MGDEWICGLVIALAVLYLLCACRKEGFDYSGSGIYYGTFHEGLANPLSLEQLSSLQFSEGMANHENKNLRMLRHPRSQVEPFTFSNAMLHAW